jgi:hypothetical protein
MAEAVLNFLCLMPDTWAWRMENTGMPRVGRDGSVRLVRNKYGQGKPDICGFKGKQGFLIELKMPGKTLAPAQILWRDRFIGKTQAPQCYRVCQSFEEVEEFWKSL